MTDSNPDAIKKKMPAWFIMILIVSTIVFIAFMILMGAMLPNERG